MFSIVPYKLQQRQTQTWFKNQLRFIFISSTSHT